MSSEEEYSEAEVLTGAELYLYLRRKNEEQLRQVQEKLKEYVSLKKTLLTLTERSRRRVLAPVAGGLAYFPAELTSTNTFLVLLGDGWFAERSAAQAAEVAQRRVDFLRREAAVLQEEHNALEAKQEMFFSEVPEAQRAVSQLLAETELRSRGGLAALPSASIQEPEMTPDGQPVSRTTPSSSPPFAFNPLASAQHNMLDHAQMPVVTGVPEPPPSAPHFSPDTAPTSVGETAIDLASIDEDLATFDAMDELTEDELIALEEELGDRVNDDAYVESIMTAHMIAKKEKRIRAELQRRGKAAGSTGGVGPAAINAPRTDHPTDAAALEPIDQSSSHATPCAPSVKVEYRNPGDIGNICGTSIASTTRTLAQAADVHGARDAPTEHNSTEEIIGEAVLASTDSKGKSEDTSSSDCGKSANTASALRAAPTGPRRQKHVSFHETVLEPVKSISSPSVSSALRSSPSFGGESSSPTQGNSLLRSTYTVGDIVEHQGGASLVALGVVDPITTSSSSLPGQRQKPKRKSLFAQEQERDDAL